jgi:hypothetical protein
MKKSAVRLLLFVLLFAGDLFAQTGLLQGTVARETGARLSNARLTITDAGGKVVVEGMSGPTGEFSLSVPLGEYDLNINAGGFGQIRQRVRIVPGVLHLPITVVQLPDGIDMRGNPLQSVANGNAIVLDEEFLSMLSDDNGEFAIALGGSRLFGPGTTQASDPQSGLFNGPGGSGIGAPIPAGFGGGGLGAPFGNQGRPGGGVGLGAPFGGSGITLTPTSAVGEPRLSGPRANMTRPEFIIDGQPGRLPLKDLVREVWIDSDPFTTEYSRPGFGRIHVSSLFPSREVHGSAAFNFRDESMDSPVLAFRPPYQSRHFHGEVGGPLIREKLFGTLGAMRSGRDTGRRVVSAVTPEGPVDRELDNGGTNQIFDGRSQYRISERHQLNVSSRYRSEVFPHLGFGNINLPEQDTRLAMRGWDFQAREVSHLGSNAVHELRFQVRRDTRHSAPVKEGTTLTVFGAFSGGGTSARSDYRDTQYQIENLFAWSTPQWTFRTGAQGYHVDKFSDVRGNVLGTFLFSSLSQYQAGIPSFYTQSLGSTTSNVRQTEVSTFAQGEWNASSRFSLSGGLRYEVQTNLRDRNNIDPRIALAYQIQSGLTLRVGAGLFHQRFSVDDAATLESADGAAAPSFIFASSPSFPNVERSTAAEFSARNPIAFRNPDLAAPYLVVSSLSLDKWFNNGLLVSASVDVTRGMRQFRVRDANAPFLRDVADPTALTLDEVNQRRPFYPLAIVLSRYESVGFLEAKNMSLRVRTPELRAWKLGMRFNGDYTLGFSEDDDGLPIDHYNRRAEWGRSSYYPRHTFWMGAITRAPWRISLAALAQAHSGFPYSALPASTGKNANDGPNSFNLDLKLAKTVTVRKLEASLFAYGQNVLNSRNYTIFSTSFSSFSTNPSTRRMELGVRLRF